MALDMNTLAVTGMSYVLKDRCGALSRGIEETCATPREASRVLEARGSIKGLPKNWGRFDQVSLTTFAAVLWACVDAELLIAQGKRRVGVVGMNTRGSLDANKAFFEDYVSAGRGSARSNLFVYTLPTTPLAEAALYCGFCGPLWYMHRLKDGAARVIEEAALCVEHQGVEAMVVVFADACEAVGCVIEKGRSSAVASATVIRDKLRNKTTVGEILQTIDVFSKDRGIL